MAPERPLGKHEHAVFRHFKDATTPLEDLDRRLGIRLSDLGRQTGGPWFVVSNDAIADRDVHGGVNSDQGLVISKLINNP